MNPIVSGFRSLARRSMAAVLLLSVLPLLPAVGLLGLHPLFPQQRLAMKCCRHKAAPCCCRTGKSSQERPSWAAAPRCTDRCWQGASLLTWESAVVHAEVASGRVESGVRLNWLPHPPVAVAAYLAFLYQRPPPLR